MEAYYSIGDIKTTTPWITPPPLENINKWWEEFSQNEFGEYKVYLGGKVVIDLPNTNDVDIILIGPVYDYQILYNLLKDATKLGFKNQILIDICHYDNIDFFKYPRSKDFTRYHLRTRLGGEEIKKINGEIILENKFTTSILNHNIPKELAVNLVKFPMEKQIEDGRVYNPILLK
jgi:hypothetical protein